MKAKIPTLLEVYTHTTAQHVPSSLGKQERERLDLQSRNHWTRVLCALLLTNRIGTSSTPASGCAPGSAAEPEPARHGGDAPQKLVVPFVVPLQNCCLGPDEELASRAGPAGDQRAQLLLSITQSVFGAPLFSVQMCCSLRSCLTLTSCHHYSAFTF
ncbi:hypothetical protein FQA47_022527 [Oryzias melastigma]|uniref:Uncharacterized protein n=1 Tax=Oryzias melastigma TaxID=30732 RepID=A0A834FDE9_ORYME|nr:hypothetical protein FQA47_022527 [Oryzias melastigma]